MESTMSRMSNLGQGDRQRGEAQHGETRQGGMERGGGNMRSQHSEGTVAKTIEEQTAKIPSDVFLWAALGSIGGSLVLQMCGRQHESLFVGQWAPTFLILGLYNKIVKIAGSDPMPRHAG